MTRPLILGFGRDDSEDDGAGPHVIDRLRRAGIDADLRVIRADPGDLNMALDGRTEAVLVDACRSGAAPGHIHEIDLAAGPLPGIGSGRHGMDLSQAIALVHALHGLPKLCRLIAIEGTAFRLGYPMSSAVALAADRVAARLEVSYQPAFGRIQSKKQERVR